MKQFFTLLLICISISAVQAQDVPQGMQYQAIARDLKGDIIANQPISLKISLLNPATNNVFYVETHDIITSQLGLFNLVIGGGKLESGSFNTVPWGADDVWLQVSIKTKGQTNFTLIGNNKLFTVPYAFHSGTAKSVSGTVTQNQALQADACDCKEGIKSVQVLYLGNNSATIKVFDNKDLKKQIFIFSGKNNGAIFDITAAAPDKKLPNSLFIQISGSATVTEIPTGCNDAIVGETFGNLSVVSRTDVKNGIVCSVCDIKKDWKVGGNVVLAACNMLGSKNKSDLMVITDNTERIRVRTNGDVEIKNTTQSTSKDDGALVVEGGVGIKQNLNVGGNANVIGATTLNNTLGVSGITSITNSTQSSTPANGALIVTGGVGIEKNLNIGGNANVTGTTNLNSTLDVTGVTHLKNTLVTDGATTLNNTLGVSGITSITNSTQSSTPANGALIVTGGVGIGGNLNVAGATNFGSVGTNNLTARSLNVVNDTSKYLATFQNTNTGEGDGINIKLGKEKTFFAPPALPTLDATILTQIKDLISNNFIAQKSQIFGNIVLEGAKETGKVLAGLAVGAGNMIVNVINDKLGLPLSIPALDVPAINFPALTTPKFVLHTPIGFPNIDFPGINVTDGFEITPKFHLLDATTVMPKLPQIDLTSIGIPTIDFTDMNFWSVPSFDLSDITTNPLNNSNEFIRFSDKNDVKMGSIKAASLKDFSDNYLNPVFLYKLYGAITSSTVDKVHALYHFKSEIFKVLKDYYYLGVEYSSGNGDYAEWLPRIDKNENISAGDIIGVVGGKITKNLKSAEQVMVVSSNPIILGNIPAEGKNYDGNTIAFMGQVPVKIVGPVITGDYIIGQSNTPGYGIAKHPNTMSVEDFRNAVGRSWVTDESDLPKMVNTVVGIHNNNFLNVIKELKTEVETNEARIKVIENRLNTPVHLKSRISTKQNLK